MPDSLCSSCMSHIKGCSVFLARGLTSEKRQKLCKKVYEPISDNAAKKRVLALQNSILLQKVQAENTNLLEK